MHTPGADRTFRYAHAEHAHESAHPDEPGFDVPAHVDVHAPSPQFCIVPAHAASCVPHSSVQEPLPQLNWRLPQPSDPSQTSVHASMSGHVTLPPSHESVPMHWTRHAYPAGQTMSSPSQRPSGQSMTQIPPAQPPLHSPEQLAGSPVGVGSTGHASLHAPPTHPRPGSQG
jgi:hypothetical protein